MGHNYYLQRTHLGTVVSKPLLGQNIFPRNFLMLIGKPLMYLLFVFSVHTAHGWLRPLPSMKPDSLLWNLASLLWEIVWTQQGFQIFDTILWLALTLIAVINCTVSKLIRTKTSRIIAINQTAYQQPSIKTTISNFTSNFSWKFCCDKTKQEAEWKQQVLLRRHILCWIWI